MKKLIVLFVICAEIGCVQNQNKASDSKDLSIKPLVVLNDKDDGWGADLRLSVVDITENDSAKVYKAISSYNKKNLGFLLFIPKQKTNDKGFGNGITLKSVGIESDNLLHELAKRYKQSVPVDSKFVESASASFVDLGEFSKSLGGKVVGNDPNVDEYKLFFETKDDEGELFVNINLVDKWVELSEKDPEYRPIMIKALTR